MLSLEEARERRVDAERSGDTVAWVRARAEEEFLQEGLRDLANRLTNTVPRPGPAPSRGPFDALHPRDREGKFRQVIGKLKAGEKVHVGHGVHVTKTRAGHYTVHGGIGKPRQVKGRKYAAREALERQAVADNALKIAALKPGHGVTIGTTTVIRHKDLPSKLIVARNAIGTNQLEGTTLHDSAIDAAKTARQHEFEKNTVRATTRRAAVKQKKDYARAYVGGEAKPLAYEHAERIDRYNPPDSRADIHAIPPEQLGSAPGTMTRNPLVAAEKEHGGTPGGEHAGAASEHLGKLDPGTVSHLDAAHSSKLAATADHVHGTALDIVTKAAPHVGAGKHREALKAAGRAVQSVGPDVIHTVSHVLSQLLGARVARVNAPDTTAWSRARALEEHWQRQLESYGFDPALVVELEEALFDSHKHPRDRRGEFKGVGGSRQNHPKGRA